MIEHVALLDAEVVRVRRVEVLKVASDLWLCAPRGTREQINIHHGDVIASSRWQRDNLATHLVVELESDLRVSRAAANNDLVAAVGEADPV